MTNYGTIGASYGDQSSARSFAPTPAYGRSPAPSRGGQGGARDSFDRFAPASVGVGASRSTPRQRSASTAPPDWAAMAAQVPRMGMHAAGAVDPRTLAYGMRTSPTMHPQSLPPTLASPQSNTLQPRSFGAPVVDAELVSAEENAIYRDRRTEAEKRQREARQNLSAARSVTQFTNSEAVDVVPSRLPKPVPKAKRGARHTRSDDDDDDDDDGNGGDNFDGDDIQGKDGQKARHVCLTTENDHRSDPRKRSRSMFGQGKPGAPRDKNTDMNNDDTRTCDPARPMGEHRARASAAAPRLQTMPHRQSQSTNPDVDQRRGIREDDYNSNNGGAVASNDMSRALPHARPASGDGNAVGSHDRRHQAYSIPDSRYSREQHYPQDSETCSDMGQLCLDDVDISASQPMPRYREREPPTASTQEAFVQPTFLRGPDAHNSLHPSYVPAPLSTPSPQPVDSRTSDAARQRDPSYFRHDHQQRQNHAHGPSGDDHRYGSGDGEHARFPPTGAGVSGSEYHAHDMAERRSQAQHAMRSSSQVLDANAHHTSSKPLPFFYQEATTHSGTQPSAHDEGLRSRAAPSVQDQGIADEKPAARNVSAPDIVAWLIAAQAKLAERIDQLDTLMVQCNERLSRDGGLIARNDVAELVRAWDTHMEEIDERIDSSERATNEARERLLLAAAQNNALASRVDQIRARIRKAERWQDRPLVREMWACVLKQTVAYDRLPSDYHRLCRQLARRRRRQRQARVDRDGIKNDAKRGHGRPDGSESGLHHRQPTDDGDGSDSDDSDSQHDNASDDSIGVSSGTDSESDSVRTRGVSKPKPDIIVHIINPGSWLLVGHQLREDTDADGRPSLFRRTFTADPTIGAQNAYWIKCADIDSGVQLLGRYAFRPPASMHAPPQHRTDTALPQPISSSVAAKDTPDAPLREQSRRTRDRPAALRAPAARQTTTTNATPENRNNDRRPTNDSQSASTRRASLHSTRPHQSKDIDGVSEFSDDDDDEENNNDDVSGDNDGGARGRQSASGDNDVRQTCPRDAQDAQRQSPQTQMSSASAFAKADMNAGFPLSGGTAPLPSPNGSARVTLHGTRQPRRPAQAHQLNAAADDHRVGGSAHQENTAANIEQTEVAHGHADRREEAMGGTESMRDGT